MEIKLQKITVRDIFNGYDDKGDEGVIGFGGSLNIRPPYQREFIYGKKERDEVIRSISEGFPLNIMYWVVRDDRHFEVMDGQQRIISFCRYVKGDFSVYFRGGLREDPLAFHNLGKEKQEQILNYSLDVYFCQGTDDEILNWFNIINIAGKELSAQEIRNATYPGPWLADAKLWFSRPNAPAQELGKHYIKGEFIRQKYLETALEWISGNNNNIKNYMSSHQHDKSAKELWDHFSSVIEWVESTFTNYRKEMKKVNWGRLYKKCHMKQYDANQLEMEIKKLMENYNVRNKAGIYDYVLTKNKRSLNLRQFDDTQKREAYERQRGICRICGKHFKIEDMEADHIKPWSKGGQTIAENCQMLCKADNLYKSDR